MAVSSPTSRQAIVDAAVALADAEGLEAVSMRRLAEKLGVATMTPYTYIANKEELLDLMRDEVGRAMLVPEPLPEHWREAVEAIARRTRAAFEAHPWIADAPPRLPQIRINLARHIEQSVGAIEKLGLERGEGSAVLTAVDDYVIGHCLRRRSRARALRNAPAPGLDPEVSAAIEAGELTRIAPLLERRGANRFAAGPPEADFEAGLRWLLDGIERTAGGDQAPR